jgi:hypothetical protein
MPLKDKLTELRWVEKINEQDLTVTLRNGSTISVRGTDNFDALRGVGLHFLVMDEFADSNPDAWTRVLRPTLSDTGGHALFLGTPKGRNHLYELWERGQVQEPGWASWQFTTADGGNVPPEEIEAARRDLDERTFSAEYLANFVTFEGRCYYPFTRQTHCAALTYDPKAPLLIAMDFNCEPGVACVLQEQPLPNGLLGTGAIGEVYIPRNSTTPAVCRRLLQDWGHHPGPVRIYADATGGARGSARVLGSDVDLIRAELQPVFRDRLSMRVPSANPPERVRVNAVNSRLRSASGEIRFMIDPTKAPNLVRDLEGVALLKGGSGEIDKRSNPTLSHISDACGYYIAKEFPILSRTLVLGELVRG